MRRFFLSINTKFPFVQFGFQHIIMICITALLFILVYVNRNKLHNLNENKVKRIRTIIALIILLNMLIYRLAYIYYGVYDVKVHLDLYYCHIVNYLFVLSLLLNYKPFYKIVFGLSWAGSIWTVFFPDLSGGIDCFIFYQSFISHNVLLVFTTIIIIIKNIKLNSLDCIKSILFSIGIMGFTYIINYDFGTKYNNPALILKGYISLTTTQKYLILVLMGICGIIVGKIINYIYLKGKDD